MSVADSTSADDANVNHVDIKRGSSPTVREGSHLVSIGTMLSPP
jgi:hypothetical protein